MKTQRKHFSLSDFFFAEHGDRPPAKSRVAKMLTVFKAQPGEYAKQASGGGLQRMTPRKFRRGRIRWVDGKMDTSAVRFKVK